MKLKLNSWIKTNTACGHSVGNCWHCVQKVYGNDMLPYQNVTEWMEAFCQGQDVTKDNQCAGQPNIPQELVQLAKSLLEDDMHRPMCKLAVEVGILDFGVRHIIMDIIKMQKMPSCWVLHQLKSTNMWQRHATANLNLQRYHNENYALLQCITPPWQNLGSGLQTWTKMAN